MSLKEITCKCPKCGEEFALGEALEEQAVEQVRAELASQNNDDVEVRIEAVKAQALIEGKKQAAKDTLVQATKKQQELDDAQEEVTLMKLEKIERNSELTKLRNQQDFKIALKLAEEKSQWDADKDSSEKAFTLRIQQLTDDLGRASERAKQGSMQAQGEASELAIEDTLQRLFPNDEVIEVKKGQRGADCVLLVKNNLGRSVGKILFESKDTKAFSSEWVQKLKTDAISEGAQIPVLVTRAWPSENNKAHLQNGVWVCGFHEYPILVRALRQSLMDLAKVTASENAREGKAQVMYDFLTSHEFAHAIEQMVTPIFRMHEQLQKEKRSITRLWKERETLIEGTIFGTESLYMKIQGIAQVNLPPVVGMEQIEKLGEG